MLGRTSQEVMPGVASGEVRLAARGSDASQEAKDVRSQRKEIRRAIKPCFSSP